MVTASIPFPAARTPRLHRSPRPHTPLYERVPAGGAAALAIGGTMLAIGVATVGLLVVPVAALLAFGPALLAAF